jgi:Zn-dependent protease
MANFLGRTNMIDFLYLIPAILIALTLHELAHGYVAYRLGDSTAKDLGRLTLNPLKHIDPMGFFALLIFRFGWAKPVPVNPAYFQGNRRRGMFFVALAGPATNFVLALFAALLIVSVPLFQTGVAFLFLRQLFFISTLLGVFNLLPVPPLDGSKVLAYFVPQSVAVQLDRLEQYAPIILILLIFTGTLSRVLMPMVTFANSLILKLAVSIASIF